MIVFWRWFSVSGDAPGGLKIIIYQASFQKMGFIEKSNKCVLPVFAG